MMVCIQNTARHMGCDLVQSFIWSSVLHARLDLEALLKEYSVDVAGGAKTEAIQNCPVWPRRSQAARPCGADPPVPIIRPALALVGGRID